MSKYHEAEETVEVGGKQVKRTRVCQHLRKGRLTTGDDVLVGADNKVYRENKDGSLQLLNNEPKGKKARKAAKRMRQQTRKQAEEQDL